MWIASSPSSKAAVPRAGTREGGETEAAAEGLGETDGETDAEVSGAAGRATSAQIALGVPHAMDAVHRADEARRAAKEVRLTRGATAGARRPLVPSWPRGLGSSSSHSVLSSRRGPRTLRNSSPSLDKLNNLVSRMRVLQRHCALNGPARKDPSVPMAAARSYIAGLP